MDGGTGVAPEVVVATSASLNRQGVLARRRLALVALLALALVTLVVAIITGSVPLLVLTLVVDVLLAGYIAVLVQIKQRQAALRGRAGEGADRARAASW